ncbi:hypothetical protein Tco_1034029 [Tanacetum coccineum]
MVEAKSSSEGRHIVAGEHQAWSSESMLSPCSKYWLWTKRGTLNPFLLRIQPFFFGLLSLLPEETLLLTLPHEGGTLLLTLSLEETLLLTSCVDTTPSSLPLDLRWPSSPQLLKRTVVTWSGFVLGIL